MTLDRTLLAAKVVALDRHLDRVAARLPSESKDLTPASDASDAVILHLWQAVQIAVDVALALCLRLKLETPAGYGDAFKQLARAGVLDQTLAERLARAAGFRNVVAHAYESLDMARIHRAAREGPADLRSFFAAVRDALPPDPRHGGER